MDMIDTIAFDADDTLWHTEKFYREAERKMFSMLAEYGVTTDLASETLHKIEIENLAFFGYGIRGFTFSLIETAIQITDAKISADQIQQIIHLGKEMTTHEILLLNGVREALDGLAGKKLILVTKGDALDQESKITRSGLGNYFQHIEIMVDKTPAAYQRLLRHLAIDPTSFLMVGNSLRSDIAPVLKLGGYAVYIPYSMNWEHESDANMPEDRSRYYEVEDLHALPGLIQQLDAASKVSQ